MLNRIVNSTDKIKILEKITIFLPILLAFLGMTWYNYDECLSLSAEFQHIFRKGEITSSPCY